VAAGEGAPLPAVGAGEPRRAGLLAGLAQPTSCAPPPLAPAAGHEALCRAQPHGRRQRRRDLPHGRERERGSCVLIVLVMIRIAWHSTPRREQPHAAKAAATHAQPSTLTLAPWKGLAPAAVEPC